MSQSRVRLRGLFGIAVAAVLLCGGFDEVTGQDSCLPGADFASLDCRLDELIAQTGADVTAGALPAVLLSEVERAKLRKEQAEAHCTRGLTRRAKSRLQNAIRRLIGYRHRLGTLGKRWRGDVELRAKALDILRDMQVLRDSLVCPPSGATTTTQTQPSTTVTTATTSTSTTSTIGGPTTSTTATTATAPPTTTTSSTEPPTTTTETTATTTTATTPTASTSTVTTSTGSTSTAPTSTATTSTATTSTESTSTATTSTATTSTETTSTAPTTTASTSTATTSSSTSTTMQACTPIVPSTPIPNTYQLNGITGEQRCTTGAAANRFGTCSSDAECGGTAGACRQLPWVTADGQEMPFPAGVQTTFTVAAAGSFPTCEHAACVPCGNANAPCGGIPGCEVAGNPNGCVPRGTQGCCSQPGFVVPTFTVNILGGLCSRVDQIGCGVGVVNTSDPQMGDNDVNKQGDTSDPGPDCEYNTADDPAQPACSFIGQGNDYAGKIVRTVGNGAVDAPGIHFRLVTPELSTTWMDSANPCPQGSTFDNGEGLISQLIIKAEPTSAGASGAFVELGPTGNTCKRAGSGFTSALPDGPIMVAGAPAGPLRPQSYDGTVGAVTGAVSVVFSGPNSPIRDIGFVAITPNSPAVVVAPQACSCTVVPGCPE